MNPSIQKELQELVAANIISQETANNIENYYRSKEQPTANRFAIVLSILGALLVGLGIVLVVAHNWDELGRVPQTIFAFLPMVVGQALCFYTLSKQKESFAWREGSALILFFGVGSCIALISQIYHIGGSLSAFLLTWMLLTIALLYVMPSYITGLLYIAGITWYACVVGYFDSPDQQPWLFLPLLLLVAPAYWKLLRTKSESNIFILYNWFIAIALTCVLGAFTSRNDDSARGFLGYLTLFSLYYFAGTSNLFRHRRLFANPYTVAGIPGIVGILLYWTYSFAWIRWDDDVKFNTTFTYILIVLLFGLLATIAWRYRRRGWEGLSLVEFSPFIFLIAVALTSRNLSDNEYDSYTSYGAMPGVLIINAWVLVLGIYFTRKGSIQQHFGILNLGLLIIAALAVLRFFDDNIPFVWRGIFFLATGIGFFVANYLLIKKKRSLAVKQSV
jgi:uncharacterized membrane protein